MHTAKRVLPIEVPNCSHHREYKKNRGDPGGKSEQTTANLVAGGGHGIGLVVWRATIKSAGTWLRFYERKLSRARSLAAPRHQFPLLLHFLPPYSLAERGLPYFFTASPLGLHRFHQRGGGGTFDGKSVTNLPHDTFLERLNEVDARVAARYFGAFKYNLANSCARMSALPLGTTSATTPHSCAIRAVSGRGFNRKASARPAPAR